MAAPLDSARAIAESLLSFASGVIGAGGEITPMFTIVDAAGKVTVAATPWNDDEEKVALVKTVRAEMRRIGATHYGFVSEAWSISVQPGDPHIAPSQSDRRVEVVIISAADSAGVKLTCSAEIIRAPGAAPRLAEPKWADHATGRMTSLLDRTEQPLPN